MSGQDVPATGPDAVAHPAATGSPEELAVGVDLGGTKIAACLVRRDGTLVGQVHEVPTPAHDGPEAMLDAIAGLVLRTVAAGTQRAGSQATAGCEADAVATSEAGASPDAVGTAASGTAAPAAGEGPAAGAPGAAAVVAVGIGSAGVIDAETGIVLASTDAISHWPGTPVAAGVAHRLAAAGLHQADGSAPLVHVDNDVNAYAAGEAWLGAGRGCASALVVAVGTGVGGGVVLDGRVHHGRHFLAGEMGHMPSALAAGERCTCGRDGHLEAVAAGPQIARRYRQASGDHTVTTALEVERRADAGDALAQRVYTEAAVALGTAITQLVTVLDPDVVIVSGGLARSGDLWWQPLRSTVRSELIDLVADTPIVPARLGTRAPIIGAAHEAWQRARPAVHDEQQGKDTLS